MCVSVFRVENGKEQQGQNSVKKTKEEENFELGQRMVIFEVVVEGCVQVWLESLKVL